MIYRVSEIERDVRVAIDENSASIPLVAGGDIDTLELNEIIRSKIEEGVRVVEMSAPTYFLEDGHWFGEDIHWGDHGSGWVYLPDDFMRLISFRMSDWERTLYGALSTEDPEYRKQSSRFRGIRGTSQKPVCAIVGRPEGRVLEFYSCDSEDAYVSQGVYLPYPEIDKAGGIEISERCYRSAVYMIGALVLMSYGEKERSVELGEMSKKLIE